MSRWPHFIYDENNDTKYTTTTITMITMTINVVTIATFITAAVIITTAPAVTHTTEI